MLVCQEVLFDVEYIVQYVVVCGFVLVYGVLMMYLYLLGFLLQFMLMMELVFLYLVIGLVYLCNMICQYQYLKVGECVCVEVCLCWLFYYVCGQVFVIEMVIIRGSVVVWELFFIYLCVGVFFLQGVLLIVLFMVQDLLFIGCWDVFVDIGWCYVGVLGDWNFIYVFNIGVKLFGFVYFIVYGMWMKVCVLVVLLLVVFFI